MLNLTIYVFGFFFFFQFIKKFNWRTVALLWEAHNPKELNEAKKGHPSSPTMIEPKIPNHLLDPSGNNETWAFRSYAPEVIMWKWEQHVCAGVHIRSINSSGSHLKFHNVHIHPT